MIAKLRLDVKDANFEFVLETTKDLKGEIKEVIHFYKGSLTKQEYDIVSEWFENQKKCGLEPTIFEVMEKDSYGNRVGVSSFQICGRAVNYDKLHEYIDNFINKLKSIDNFSMFEHYIMGLLQCKEELFGAGIDDSFGK